MGIVYTPPKTPAPVIPVLGADNGLSVDGITKNVELGGSLIKDTLIDATSQNIKIGGAVGDYLNMPLASANSFEFLRGNSVLESYARMSLSTSLEARLESSSGTNKNYIDITQVLLKLFASVPGVGSAFMEFDPANGIKVTSLQVGGPGKPMTYDSDYSVNMTHPNDIPSILFVQSLITGGLAGYVTNAALTSALANYVLTSFLTANYSTTTAMNTAISTALTNYVLTSFLTANYSTTTAMNTAINTALASQLIFRFGSANSINGLTTTTTITSYAIPGMVQLRIVADAFFLITNITGTLTATLNYTDINSVAQSVVIFPGSTGTTVGGYACLSRMVVAKGSTTVSIIATVTGTVTYNANAVLEIG